VNERERDPSLETGYELGAATPEEAVEFAETAAELGLSAEPVQPPKEIRAALLAKIASTPQHLPIAPQPTGDTDPVSASNDAEETPAAGPAERRARARWFRRPAAIAVAAAAAVALIIAGTLVGVGISEHAFAPAHPGTSVSQISAEPDAQHATTKIATGGVAKLVWSVDLRKAAITLYGLQRAPSGKTYELWYLRGKRAVPAGTVNVSSRGATTRILDGKMEAGDTVAVTVEPRGGSKQPTSLPILAIRS
jgi:anti-sigma-K factor RskA